jgi:hypothetical protein
VVALVDPAGGLEDHLDHGDVDGLVHGRVVRDQHESARPEHRDRASRLEAVLVTGLGVHGRTVPEPERGFALVGIDLEAPGLALELEHLEQAGRGDLGEVPAQLLDGLRGRHDGPLLARVDVLGLQAAEGNRLLADPDDIARREVTRSADGLVVQEGAVGAVQVAYSPSLTPGEYLGVTSGGRPGGQREVAGGPPPDHHRVSRHEGAGGLRWGEEKETAGVPHRT